MPPELVPQFPLLREVLEVMRISTVDIAGYEADDIIGTLSRICEEENGECVVLSGDKDTLQLVSDKTTVWITRKGISQTEKFTPQYLKESMGLTPEQIIDYKALAGDSSDNIPGISSVGEKPRLSCWKAIKPRKACWITQKHRRKAGTAHRGAAGAGTSQQAAGHYRPQCAP